MLTVTLPTRPAVVSGKAVDLDIPLVEVMASTELANRRHGVPDGVKVLPQPSQDLFTPAAFDLAVG